mmetsp:Transcript_42803/g.56559  ORF Transcript_42803/g.56559 Transcript_42803/m.56559 type:complete len:80 (+) Transcript_42803:2184-2423(+)
MPKPIDKSNADYVENQGPGGAGYNMNFEPYASKYDNKLIVDMEGNGDVIGVMQRPKGNNKNTSEMSAQDDSTIDMKFEF